MCNKYLSPEAAEIERFWYVGARNPKSSQQEIFPRAPGPFIRRRKEATGSGASAASSLRRGAVLGAVRTAVHKVRVVALLARGRRALRFGRALNVWVDKATGEEHESFTMLTLNADAHPLMAAWTSADAF